MNVNRVKEIVVANKECLETIVNPSSSCDDCDVCPLNYQKGTMGEQIEAFEEILKLIDNSDLISREKMRKTIVDGTKFDTRQDYVRVLDAIESVPSYTSYN